MCYAAFAVSGFAGLVYESVWSRYLQIFLGAETYAQALVLALFLGGMAVGAWLAARRSGTLARPLLGYAVIELLLAIVALGFHPLFEATTDWTFSTAAPALAIPWVVESWKWALASALILPQCVLLGATFPLLAAGVIRHGKGRPSGRGQPGHALGWLYFANCAGGAVGVLANGFLLVPVLGLPGAVTVAGLLSALAGALVWTAGRLLRMERPARLLEPMRPFERQRLCLAAAAVTGAASLVYELVWIRMLNLVLGSSTHSFELMLSAFIGGLALGGFWIRSRADRIANPLLALGVIQLAMGTLALATIFLYREMFNAMHWMLQGLARTAPGYTLFLLGSHALALAVMLPATVCAGMTLPLLTRHQLTAGGGERVIGRTYAANTLGAIAGVFATMHLLLPQLGIKGAMLVGAGLDLGLGAWLAVCAGAWMRVRIAGGVFAAAALAVAWLAPGLDLRVLNSGVFVGADPNAHSEESEMLFYRHGKTATIGVTRYRLGEDAEIVGFTTNGKGNGSLLIGAPREQAGADEPSFGLLGLLPLLLKPEAEQAACIGVGTGLSAHNLLGSPRLAHLDIVELEPVTIEAARFFADRTGRIFTDPRVRFHSADAKTFFGSRSGPGYDVILSQPSNVWMPGVAGLFTDEFYAGLRDALADDGILVQWMQLYAADEQMVLSVLHALGRNFADYRLYLATASDLLVVAVKEGRVPIPQEDAFDWPAAVDAWARIGVLHEGDLRLRWAGDRTQVEPAIAVAGALPNSDYRPLLELRALQAFYRRSGYRAFDYWSDAFGYPLLANLAGRDTGSGSGSAAPTERQFFPRSLAAAEAARLAALLQTAPNEGEAWQGETPALGTLLPLDRWLALLDEAPCPDFVADAYWGRFLPWLVRVAGPNLGQEDLRAMWDALNARRCIAELRAGGSEPHLHDFVGAALLRDYETVAALGPSLLEDENPAHRPFVTVATATAFLKLGASNELQALMERMAPPVPPRLRDAMALVAAHTTMRETAPE